LSTVFYNANSKSHTFRTQKEKATLEGDDKSLILLKAVIGIEAMNKAFAVNFRAISPNSPYVLKQ